MKILCLVHCETMFEEWMCSDFHYLMAEAVHTLEYDKVFVLNSDINETGDASGLLPYVQGLLIHHPLAEEIIWSWGYELDQAYEDDDTWTIPSTGHEATWVPEELRNLPEGTEAILVGGGDTECLEDFRCVLNHLGIAHHTYAAY